MIPERLTNGIHYLRNRGFQVKLGQHINDVNGYLAGRDADRLSDLNEMFYDEDVAAIFCTRGGYGTPRILEQIDYSAIQRRPKILVGYSDITALQLAIFKQTGLVTFSGPMVAVEMAKGIDPFTESNFWKMLTGPQARLQMRVPADSNFCLKPGNAKGRLLGGCLSLICSLLGTQFLPDFHGAILFLEDVGEEPYRIDRMFNQLRLAGVLNDVNGIVFGQFPDCVPKSDAPSMALPEVISELTAELNVPVIVDFPYGHVDAKYTLPIGVEAMLDADAGLLEICEPAVIA